MITALGDLLAEKTGATPPTVIAIHGWMRTGLDFATILDGLDAVAPHMWGFGKTAEPPTAWGSEQYADALAEAIRPFGPVVIVGHSFGGRVAVWLAYKYPELVKGILLTGVPLVRLTAPPKPKLAFRVIRSLSKAKLLPASVLENQRRKHGSADYRNATGVMRDILVKLVGETYVPQLESIRVPVRLVYGEHDTAAPADAGQAASELIPDASYRFVPGGGHLLDGTTSIAVREELLALIAEVNA